MPKYFGLFRLWYPLPRYFVVSFFGGPPRQRIENDKPAILLPGLVRDVYFAFVVADSTLLLIIAIWILQEPLGFIQTSCESSAHGLRQWGAIDSWWQFAISQVGKDINFKGS